MAIDLTEVKRRLMAILKDANMVNEYIRQFGPAMDMKNIKIVKEQHARSIPSEDEEEGKDPVYEIKVTCPVCSYDEVPCYDLRAKSQQVLQNLFLVPTYKGAMGHKTVDYTLIAASVCPRCLFTSPDKKDFNRLAPNGQNMVKTQLASNALMTLQEKIGERKAILKSVTDYKQYFTRPRTFDAALDSYRLALSRAKVEMWYELPFSVYKAGAYSFRMAKILKQSGVDNRAVLREAVSYYEEAFRTSNCPAEEIEMQVIYTLVAAYLKLGEQKKAHSFIAVFTNLINQRNAEMKVNPKVNTMTMERWAEKANRLWEDKDEPMIFDDV